MFSASSPCNVSLPTPKHFARDVLCHVSECWSKVTFLLMLSVSRLTYLIPLPLRIHLLLQELGHPNAHLVADV